MIVANVGFSVTHPFDLNLFSAGTVGQAILEPLDSLSVQRIVVDVGARNGMSLLPESYTRDAKLVGFEPNKVEHQKLIDGATDAVRAGVPPAPRFKEEQYFDCALWDRAERRTFYVTVGPGACTLMGNSDEGVTNRMFLDYRNDWSRKSYSELHTNVVETMEVDCRPLDDLLIGEKIDFLKLDVEGAELRALKGAETLLSTHAILFIKTEVVCFSYYVEHPLFGHQHAFLHDMGYRLLHADFGQPRYSRTPTAIPAMLDKRLQYAGDAYFMPDPDRAHLAATNLQRSAAICLSLGFRSLCISLLRDAGLLSDNAVDEIERTLSRPSMRKRVKAMWDGFPYFVQRQLSSLRIRI